MLYVIDLGLAQILPMFDEETGADPRIVRAALADPFLLLIRDDGSIFVATCDDDNELEEIEREDDSLLATKWTSGCLYADLNGIFGDTTSDEGLKTNEKHVLMFLMSAGGSLYVSLRDTPSCGR
jgi:cleavage and polyadenylation specificity factor subunit 1